jgi:hypothetical protein
MLQLRNRPRSSTTVNKSYPLGRAITVSEAVYSFRLLEALRSGQTATILPFLNAETTRVRPARELTSPLHLAIRCAECEYSPIDQTGDSVSDEAVLLCHCPVTTVQFILQNKDVDVNLVETQNGNTPLHLAAIVGRTDVLHYLLALATIDDTIRNLEGLDPMEVSKTPEITQIFQGEQDRPGSVAKGSRHIANLSL